MWFMWLITGFEKGCILAAERRQPGDRWGTAWQQGGTNGATYRHFRMKDGAAWRGVGEELEGLGRKSWFRGRCDFPTTGVF